MESVFYGFETLKQKIMSTEKDLNYYKANAEEDYKQVPISVLRYISELETAVKNCSIPLVSDHYLLKCGDLIIEGDEFVNGDSWRKTGMIGETYNDRDFKPHRRKI